MGRSARPVLLVAAATLCLGCHLIYPFSPLPADGDAGLGVDAAQGAPDAGATCQIDGVNHAALTRDSQDTCRMCDPLVSRAQWSAAPGCVVTLAGSGSQGSVDGPALSATFDGPIAVAVDHEGRVFVADWSGHRVRQIWQGQVTTVAGDGSPGHLDGPAASSRLNAPMGLAVDGAGRLNISEKNGRRIRLLHKGQVTTVAGSGASGSADGPAASASFLGPQGLAVSPGGTVYVADSSNNAVRQIVGALVSTLCGGDAGWVDGPLAAAKLHFPTGVAVGPSGAVFVADEKNHLIRRVAGGQVSTLAGIPGPGGFADGAAASARFTAPHDLAVDAAGAVYVADCGNSRVRKIQGGQVSTVAGGSWGFKDGPLASAQFGCPINVDLDRHRHLYVVDTGNNKIRVLNLAP